MSAKKRIKRQTFSEEFKQDACHQVIGEGRKVTEVAKSLGISEGVLGRWVREKRGDPDGEKRRESERIKELEAQVKRLETEKEILKKAMAYFVPIPK